MDATETAQNPTEATSQEATPVTTATAVEPVVIEQTATTLLDDPKAVVKAEAKADEPAVKALEGAPEKYEFKAPEGSELDPSVVDAFSTVAKGLNLTQENAQKVVDGVLPALQARAAAQVEAIQTGWETSARTDKEFGGDKLTENLAVAKKALDQFGSPELKTLLNQSGLGNNPEVIRLLYRAGKAISEDSFVAGKGTPTSEKSFYPNSNMK